MNPTAYIRNFCIIAHIDHGKSTLADRILERTQAIPARQMTEQVLDQLVEERERGITIKAKAVRLDYQAKDGQKYVLNLIDTPGHVDFSYEVSRSLAACEGAILLVDATQGIEAQTLANTYLALEHDLSIIPVINKIDLPSARPEEVRQSLKDVFGFLPEECLVTSAKTGEGVDDILAAVVERVPPPAGDRGAPLQALVFDSHFDPYKGVIAYVRVVAGEVKPGMQIMMMSTGRTFEVTDVGVFRPAMTPVESLGAGEVGYLAAAMKNVRDCRVGDTITEKDRPAAAPLPGYRPALPMVYCGMYPVEPSEYEELRDALEKLQLNDAAVTFEPETSEALGSGFRCGFLGLLHMDIVRERLEREYGRELIVTAPNVVYEVTTTKGERLRVQNPAALPPPSTIASLAEPHVKAQIIAPAGFVGDIMELCQGRRGQFINMEYLGSDRVLIVYDLPLGEIMFDFFDQLKSRTRGYASLDYELTGYRTEDLVKVDILVNGEIVDALSVIVHRDEAFAHGRVLVEKLRHLIPRQLFDVPIQAAIGGKVIARETIPARRKDVLAKCYGGDVTRKKKLLEKQREGKKRMKMVGSVEIPQDAFMAVLKIDK